MKAFDNLEPSGFRRGEWVGYCEGEIWHITPAAKRPKGKVYSWCALERNGAGRFYEPTLTKISERLTARANSKGSQHAHANA